MIKKMLITHSNLKIKIDNRAVTICQLVSCSISLLIQVKNLLKCEDLEFFFVIYESK